MIGLGTRSSPSALLDLLVPLMLAGSVSPRTVHAAEKPSIRMETPTTRVVPSSPLLTRSSYPTTRSSPEQPVPQPKLASSPSSVRHALYLELLGNGGIYSLNYELAVGRVGVRLGGSYFAMKADGGVGEARVSVASFPGMIEYRVFGAIHSFEVGAGVTTFLVRSDTRVLFSRVASNNVLTAATATVGYRYAPREGGLVFRAGFTPLVALSEGLPWLPLVGMSIGGQTRS